MSFSLLNHGFVKERLSCGSISVKVLDATLREFKSTFNVLQNTAMPCYNTSKIRFCDICGTSAPIARAFRIIRNNCYVERSNLLLSNVKHFLTAKINSNILVVHHRLYVKEAIHC